MSKSTSHPQPKLEGRRGHPPIFPDRRPAEIEVEVETLKKNYPEVSRNVGKFVLIKGKEIIDYFATYAAAINTGYKKFGLENFLVRHVKTDDAPLRVARCGVVPKGNDIHLLKA